jgi:hypothetical protein
LPRAFYQTRVLRPMVARGAWLLGRVEHVPDQRVPSNGAGLLVVHVIIAGRRRGAAARICATLAPWNVIIPFSVV